MLKQWGGYLLRVAPAVGLAVVLTLIGQGPAETQGGPIPRTSWDKKPDLNGIWQALNTANWDLEDASRGASPVIVTGAWGARLPGISVVEGGTIPYKPEALAKREQNRKNAMPGKPGRNEEADPELNCFLPGVPRGDIPAASVSNLAEPESDVDRLPVLVRAARDLHERQGGGADRFVDGMVECAVGRRHAGDRRDGPQRSDLVRSGRAIITATRCMWSNATRMIDQDHIMYEATIEDPNVFTRPWKISMPLYRRIEKNAQLLHFRCAEYVEEFFYTDLLVK